MKVKEPAGDEVQGDLETAMATALVMKQLPQASEALCQRLMDHRIDEDLEEDRG